MHEIFRKPGRNYYLHRQLFFTQVNDVNEIFRDLAVMVSEQVIIYCIYGTSGTYSGQER